MVKVSYSHFRSCALFVSLSFNLSPIHAYEQPAESSKRTNYQNQKRNMQSLIPNPSL